MPVHRERRLYFCWDKLAAQDRRGDVREQPVRQEGRSGEKWPGGGSLAAAETAAYCDMTPVMLVVH